MNHGCIMKHLKTFVVIGFVSALFFRIGRLVFCLFCNSLNKQKLGWPHKVSFIATPLHLNRSIH